MYDYRRQEKDKNGFVVLDSNPRIKLADSNMIQIHLIKTDSYSKFDFDKTELFVDPDSNLILVDSCPTLINRYTQNIVNSFTTRHFESKVEQNITGNIVQ